MFSVDPASLTVAPPKLNILCWRAALQQRSPRAGLQRCSAGAAAATLQLGPDAATLPRKCGAAEKCDKKLDCIATNEGYVMQYRKYSH